MMNGGNHITIQRKESQVGDGAKHETGNNRIHRLSAHVPGRTSGQRIE
jgi:hypothetical protein